jgi:hypothetical protein
MLLRDYRRRKEAKVKRNEQKVVGNFPKGSILTSVFIGVLFELVRQSVKEVDRIEAQKSKTIDTTYEDVTTN